MFVSETLFLNNYNFKIAYLIENKSRTVVTEDVLFCYLVVVFFVIINVTKCVIILTYNTIHNTVIRSIENDITSI